MYHLRYMKYTMRLECDFSEHFKSDKDVTTLTLWSSYHKSDKVVSGFCFLTIYKKAE